MNNKFRLSSNAFDRETEEERISPKKVFFISVEGNSTEKEYLQGLSKFREKLGIDVLVNIEVLERKKSDTNSAPIHVIELLEEYLELRKLDGDEMIKEIPLSLIEQHGEATIQQFIKDASQLPKEIRSKINTELTNYGYFLEYRKYLNKFDNDLDEFCILIDRDSKNHSETNMRECISYCKDKGYNCYVTNPCFEFWLLLHFSNVYEEYSDRLEYIKQNPKISAAHTFVSNEVSIRAHHGKKCIGFETKYLPKIDKAIVHSKQFPSKVDDLVENIGCNIWRLIEKMRGFNS